MRVDLMCMSALFLCVKSDGSCPGGECGIKENVPQHARDKYSLESSLKWDKHLREIETAVAEYKDCVQENCSCHASVIEEDLRIWKDGITREKVLAAKHAKVVHYQVINHTLYRSERCPINTFRCIGVEHFIFDIIHELPDVEFILNLNDLPQSPKTREPRPMFSFSKVVDKSWDIRYPAHTFWAGGPIVKPFYNTGLGRWHEHRESISKAAKNWPWEKRLGKGFFRGSRTTHKRDPLILLSRDEPDLVDAAYTKPRDTLGAEPAPTIPLEDHCQYKYLFNMIGQAASFRFKFLFLCKSLVFHAAPDMLEFFYPAMKPWVHYIPVREDLSDAKELIQFARENDEVVREIAERGGQFIWDHLRMEDVTCFWLKLLKSYAKLLSYKVTRDDSLKIVKKEFS